MLRVPKSSYLLSRLAPRRRPDAVFCQVLTRLAELYQLGEIHACHRASRSNSLNFIVVTSQGKFVFRRQNLPEDDVAYEHEVLDHLEQRGFPAPCMLPNIDGQAWSVLDGSLYSVYEFMEGYCPADFFWLPATRREIITRCGRTLGEYHRAIADLVPSHYKWNGYHPTEHRRWRTGDWFHQVLDDIRPLLEKPGASSPTDDFTRFRIDAIERMLGLESVVEERSDLSKLVIHGDYSPWNILFCSGKSPAVLDFNESRLDLTIYDVVLATFWFAWRNGHLDKDRALAFQAGYCETGRLCEMDIRLAGSVFRWIMARSMTERLHIHYLQQRPLVGLPTVLEKQHRMCVFAEQQPQQLVVGLRGTVE
jgi:Ser/Thr protein kinase RdoA (MazF antagonist)